MEVMRLLSGGRLGLVRARNRGPAPTLFIFATHLEDALGGEVYGRVGTVLHEYGWATAALDLPCHGEDLRPGEPEGLAGWQARLAAAEPLIADFVTRASAALDVLIARGHADPNRVAVCGTSRGGFAAFHFAAADRRVRAAAGFSPVTDLRAVSEFSGMRADPALAALALVAHADLLADRALWLCIGANDPRVDTDRAIAFTRAVATASVRQGRPPEVTLHVLPVPGEMATHAGPPGAHNEAARWLLRLLG